MHGHHYPTVIAVLLLAAGWVVVAGVRSHSPETDLAAPGAPLYEYAVAESVKSMMSKQEQAKLEAENRPPSPGPDYYWCENCKTYHKRQPRPASTQKKPAAAGTPAAAPAQPRQHAATPPSPGPDHYWCEHCKTYHKKKTPAASPQPAAATAARPPSPGADFYWCEKCKTYHRRKPVSQQSVEDLIVGGATNSPNRSPLIGPAEAER